MVHKPETLDADFRMHHHALIDLIEDQEALAMEQGTLDNHEDLVAELFAYVQRLISSCSPTSDQSTRKVATKRLSQLQKSLALTTSAIPSDNESIDVRLLYQYEEELTHCKKELSDVQNTLLSIYLEDDDKLSVL